MTLVPLFDLTQQFNNKNGAILVGGKLYVYYIGRTDLATTWADEDAQATNPNPVLLDNNGRAPVFVDDSYAYTLVVCDRNGAELFSQDITPGGAGSVGGRIVYHDETLTGNGTVASLLGANTFPLGVDETMTAYTGVAEGKDALILGVNGDWFSANFLSGLNNKVDWSAFNSAYLGLKGDISSKADWSALNNYFTKNETTYMLSDYIRISALNNVLQNYYTIPQTDALLDQKQDNLTFEYNDASAISSINGSALAGQGGDGNCPWISGTKVIADTQTLTSNMILQVLSSFTMSGDHNHFIGMKGGTYRFPNEYEIGSALLHTNYFMHLSGMSAYLPLSSFSSYTASIQNSLNSNWDYTNSAYSMSLNNFYNKLDVSAFSSYSAGQDSTINNITNQITNISNASGNWNDISAYQQNSANYLTGINIPESASWNEATNVVQTNSSNWNNKLDLSAFENASGNFYPMTGNPSGFLTEHQDLSYISGKIDDKLDKSESGNYYPMTGNPSGFLTQHQSLEDYYKKTETSSKEEISAAIDSIPQGDPDVNNFVQTNSSTIVDVDNVVQTNSGDWGGGVVGDFVPTSALNFVIFSNTGYLSGVSGYDISAHYAYQALRDSNGYTITSRYLTTGTAKTISSMLSGAIDYVSGGIDYVSANVGKTYTGIAPIQVNNTSNEISISGSEISAGPGIDIFSSGGYIVISGDGAEAIKNLSAGEGILVSSVDDKTIITNNISAGQGISLVYDLETNKIRIDEDNTNDYELSAGNGVTLTDDIVNKRTRIDCTANGFPITGTNGTTGFTANMDCSSMYLSTGYGAAGALIKLGTNEVSYQAYPATEVSATWNSIITATNNRSNCYCIRFTNNMTAADLADYSAYDKVTVVHSNEYTPDCMLYWDGNTKVFPSGLYCELVKGINDQNQTDWFFTTSGWTNRVWWDWD